MSKLSLPLSATDRRAQRWLIREFRNSGLSQSSFAKKVGFSRQYLCDIMNGDSRLTLSNLEKISNKLGTDAASIMKIFNF